MGVTPQFLHAIHDPGGEHLMATRPGWIVFTEEIGADIDNRAGRDYRQWSDVGFGVIVRLNYSHHGQGTIPDPARYDAFAETCANFVAGSQGCSHFIIGNEPNCIVERYDKQAPIMPESYADCFRRVCRAVIARLGPTPNYWLIPAAIGPYNAETGNWIEYHRRVLDGCQDYADGIAIHCYAHGASPELITSEAKMDAPYQHQHYNFRAYRDFIDAIPPTLRGLPVFITEFDQYDPWLDQNNGQVQAAYHEIDEWNKQPGTQKIHCLALYRWSKDDPWSIQDKPKVQEAFRQAVDRGYRVPGPSPVQPAASHTAFLPFVQGGDSTMPKTHLPSRTIDPRLITRGMVIADAVAQPGQTYWRLIRAQWFDERESGGRHHIYVETLDKAGSPIAGIPFRVFWPGGASVLSTNGRGGFDAGNFPISPSRNEFGVKIAREDVPADVVQGIGMGMDTPSGFNPGIHTSTLLVFQYVTVPIVQMPQSPIVEQPEPTPEPPPVASVAAALIDPRVAAAVMEVEAGRDGFGADGRLKIRFEAHIFRAKLGNDELWSRYFRVGTPAWTGQQWRAAADAAWQDIHTNRQADEYAAFEFALRLDAEAAYQSVSMGAGQIMGFNAQRVGYPSARAMFDAFDDSVADQMLAFANFVLSDPALHQAINAHNWPEIGRLFNGSAGAGELYHAAYVRLWGDE